MICIIICWTFLLITSHTSISWIGAFYGRLSIFNNKIVSINLIIWFYFSFLGYHTIKTAKHSLKPDFYKKVAEGTFVLRKGHWVQRLLAIKTFLKNWAYKFKWDVFK